LNTATAFQIQ